jgi:hypothetical protein
MFVKATHRVKVVQGSRIKKDAAEQREGRDTKDGWLSRHPIHDSSPLVQNTSQRETIVAIQ